MCGLFENVGYIPSVAVQVHEGVFRDGDSEAGVRALIENIVINENYITDHVNRLK